MAQVVWKTPSRWRSVGLIERTALYPALLSGLSRDVRLTADPDLALSGGDGLVLMVDRKLAEDDLALLDRFAGRVAVQPVGGVDAADLDALARRGTPLIVARDETLLASRYPAPLGMTVVVARGFGARRAEDDAVARALAGLGLEARGVDSVEPGALIVVGDATGVAAVAPAIVRARERLNAPVQLFLRDPGRLNLAAIGLAGVQVHAEEGLGLSGLWSAGALAIAFAEEPPGSERPALWARSAVIAGAPFTASAHPSLDGLADAGVIGDWDRGLHLAFSADPVSRAAALAGAARQVERQGAARLALSWNAALERVFTPRRADAAATLRRPELLVFFDLAQDLDVLAPVLEALQARAVLDLRIAVTDWLHDESPRTVARLTEMGFSIETVDRDAALRGESPDLGNSRGVLVAADANVEAHRAARGLTERARTSGLSTFSLQHGFENIGLTWRDAAPDTHDVEVNFGADRVFTWGPAAALPGWIAPSVRNAVRPLGDPKTPAVAASRLRWPQGPWTRRVAVFENLHWERYSDAWRQGVLADIAAVAASEPDTLFLLKPHHAGRWLTRHPLAAPRGRNILLADPRDPQWEPFTALALIAGADKVVTTPSTVAVDAARAGRPVALFGYGLDLSAYAPLPVLQTADDFGRFLAAPERALLRSNEAFLARTFLPGPAAHRIAAAIETRLAEQRTGLAPRRPMSSLRESGN